MVPTSTLARATGSCDLCGSPENALEFLRECDLGTLTIPYVRVPQLIDLLVLAPYLRARVPELEAVDGAEPLAKRAMRASGPRGHVGRTTGDAGQ